MTGRIASAALLLAILLGGTGIGLAARDIRTERVRFQPGATSAVVEASITGDEIVDYVLAARRGQYANISMATDNGANYFNILAPGEREVAMFNGANAENQFEGTLPESGDYTVRVYLLRSAARRHEVATYRLEMIVAAAERGATPAAPGTGAALGPAIRRALGGDWEARYFAAAVDLNGDGAQEVVTYVAGPMVCGTGGCPVFVFAPGADGHRLVARITVAQPPVRVSPRSTHGWRDLVVGIGGGGLAAGNAELQFDGTSYPGNPTVPPARPAPDLAGTEVLIGEFESYRDGTPVPAASGQR